MNANLFALFESRFPADRSACCIETHDGLYYTWDDLDRSTAKLANLLTAGDAFYDAELTENYCGFTDDDGNPVTECADPRRANRPHPYAWWPCHHGGT